MTISLGFPGKTLTIQIDTIPEKEVRHMGQPYIIFMNEILLMCDHFQTK